MSNIKEEKVGVYVEGHCKIVDDLGNVLLDKNNAIHPQNMARVFARALSNEFNFYINRIAFGNGGTVVNAAYTVTYKTPNDGQPPDVNTWDSRIYNETFSKIIDDGHTGAPNPLIGVDPGSADINTGVRPGGGSVPADDPATIPNVSGPGVRSTELGLTSQVVIYADLNSAEPTSQYLSDTFGSTRNENQNFVFDEIGLYTTGAEAINTSGYQQVNVGNRTSTDNTGLLPNTAYSFDIAVDGGTSTPILFTTPVAGGSGPSGQILYGDLCQAINTGDVTWGFTGVNPLPGGATVSITDTTGGVFPSITAAATFGYLQVESPTTGVLSAINLAGAHTTVFLAALNPPLGATLVTAVPGTVAGVQNAPTAPSTERERLLAHLIFSPVLKSMNRTLSITYTLTISVARTVM